MLLLFFCYYYCCYCCCCYCCCLSKHSPERNWFSDCKKRATNIHLNVTKYVTEKNVRFKHPSWGHLPLYSLWWEGNWRRRRWRSSWIQTLWGKEDVDEDEKEDEDQDEDLGWWRLMLEADGRICKGGRSSKSIVVQPEAWEGGGWTGGLRMTKSEIEDN